MISNRTVSGLGFLAAVLLLVGAVIFEYMLDLEPCPLCMIQRILVAVVGVFFLLAWLHGPKRLGLYIYNGVVLVVAGMGVAVAGRHVWLQNLPEGQVPECGPGLEYLLSAFPLAKAVELILSGSGECHEVAWSFLGLTIPGWTLIAFSLFMMAAVWQLTRTSE